MRDHSKHILLSRDEAVSRVLSLLDALGQGFGWRATEGDAFPDGMVERVSLTESIGRVLAFDVKAVCDMPSALTCAMDSIAVHGSAFEGLAEGQLPDTSAWRRGVDWEFANTGVAMPAGFDTAIVVEHVVFSEDEQHVTIDAAPSRTGAGTRPAGSQFRRGDVLAPAGTLVTADVAAHMGSGNVGSVPVVRKPRVAFVPTGNELVAPGVPFDPERPQAFTACGKNFETNSILVRAKVERWGGVFLPFDIVPDNPAAIRKAVEQAVRCADVVIVNAGSSKGSDDFCIEVLEEMGQVVCHETNHGPGHHSSYALVGDVPIVGISGPSGGASFTLDFYARPLVRRFLGLEPLVPKIPARLAESLPMPGHGPHGPKGAPGHEGKLPGEKRPKDHPPVSFGTPEFFTIQLMRVDHAADGVLEAHPIAGRPGGAAAMAANAYAMVGNGPGVEPPQPGDVIQIEWR